MEKTKGKEEMTSHFLSYKHIDDNISKLEIIRIGKFVLLEMIFDKTKKGVTFMIEF